MGGAFAENSSKPSDSSFQNCFATTERQDALGSGRGIVRGDRSEIGHVDAVSGGVHNKGVTTEMGWGVFENSILVGGVLLNDGHGADAIGRVDAS